ncbi:MAG: GNAT family N-acetyltransferase [Deinococcales bacterium]
MLRYFSQLSYHDPPELSYGRVLLKPLSQLSQEDWKKVHQHFKDKEISHLNGTPPSRMPLWFLKRLLKADAKRSDRLSYGIFDKTLPFEAYIGTVELYDLSRYSATLGIIIGEKAYWGKGYGPEAMTALLNYAFEELNLDYVRLNTFSDNLRAQKSFKRLGFVELKRRQAYMGREDIVMELRSSAWQHLKQNPPPWHVSFKDGF